MNTTTEKTKNGLRRAVYAMTAAANVESTQLKEAVLRLQKGRLAAENVAGRLEYEWEAAKVCLERREQLPSPEPENPLDDDDMLERVRLAVFGPSPEEIAKGIYPKTTQTD